MLRGAPLAREWRPCRPLTEQVLCAATGLQAPHCVPILQGPRRDDDIVNDHVTTITMPEHL